MLKALELAGFKSFAERTQFEFSSGITAIVGPNGSGKSNIVDAIKWVLGEQSAKSMRGKEMADVIFNGSATRPPLHTAETTLTFDNSQGWLVIDTPEVHITRRVYRSGEGEYLINRQPSRLRDIRDLFAGTGAATEAYGIIEQGKVDILLQASPRDRRLIFEEAAGISRFKAKKIESLRRLERVEQNLLRLTDIVDEVEAQLRNVRKQAAKAQRYKECADRLQQLRTQVGVADWRKLCHDRLAVEQTVARLRGERADVAARAEAIDAQILALETEIANIQEAIHERQSQASQNRERIAAALALVEHERSRRHDLDEEASRHRRQWAAMNVRASDLAQQCRDTSRELEGARQEHRAFGEQLTADERTLTDETAALDSLRAQREQCRGVYLEMTRAAAALSSEVGALESQAAAARLASGRAAERLAALAATRRTLEEQLRESRRREEDLASECRQVAQAWQHAQSQLARLREEHVHHLQRFNDLRQQHTAASERKNVLGELEQKLEGVGAGVKELLLRWRSTADGPLSQVRGLVADLFHVSVETAPMIEAALGETAQYLVVGPGREWLAWIEREAGQLSGRVGFVSLDGPSSEGPELDGRRSVLGRADRFVAAQGEYAPLVRRLLGRTWIVETLSHALALAASAPGESFVTLAGERLSADGTLVAGPRNAATGLISRRSELRALAGRIAEMDAKIADGVATQRQLEDDLHRADAAVQQLGERHGAAAAQLSEHRLRAGAAEARMTQVAEQAAVLESESDTARRQESSCASALAATRAELEKTEGHLRQTNAQIHQASAEIAQREQACHQRARQTTLAKVQLAKSEERLANLHARMRQFEHDQQERRRATDEARLQEAQCLERGRLSDRAVLEAEARMAELFLATERLATDTGSLVELRESRRLVRTRLASDAHELLAQTRRLDEQIHARLLEASEISMQRDALAGRLREDYGIELADLDATASADQQQARDEVDREIAELRHKINQMGSVNLEALRDVEELDTRYRALAAQHEDLSRAKTSLEQIIVRMNADSRRLFSETLETVRGHFQELFRKLFGGGQADIALEEGVDILESGIEIVARPPGKELRNISLMSGGEKTLTAVALLLAIFRSRPSPFCVLDEVDAALDEANIERFVTVLREFLAWTQFIIVTHSKKTMTCATTLHGVTMQESGVSKRVSVRFEDISDEGEILLSQPAGGRTPLETKAADGTQAA